MQVELTSEHKWLEQLVGEWRSEAVSNMGPDQPATTCTGKASARSLGGLWLISEEVVELPNGSVGHNVITLGFDPKQDAFVGQFISDCMTHLWPYKGTLNAQNTMLTLDSEGPRFSGEGMAKYQDIIEIVSTDHWILRGQFQDAEGHWVPFMKCDYLRVT